MRINLKEFVGLSRTPVILTPAREGGRFRAAARGKDSRARPGRAGQSRAPTFLLEIETPIEVERFDPPKPLYYRHFSSKTSKNILLFAHF